MLNGGGALRYNKYRGLLKHLKRLPESRIRGVIQSRRAVIQNQYLRLPHQRSGNGKTLSLSAGEITALLGHRGVQTTLLLLHKGFRLSQRKCLPQLFVHGIFLAPPQIFPDRPPKEHCPLGYHADLLSERFHPIFLHISAVHAHRPLRGIVKPGDHIHQRGFTRARTAYDTDGLSSAHFDIYI